MDPVQFRLDPTTNKIQLVDESTAQSFKSFLYSESSNSSGEAPEDCDLKSEILKKVSGISLANIEHEHRLQEEQLLHELDTKQDLSFVKLDSLLRSDLKNFTTRFRKKKKNVTVTVLETESHSLTSTAAGMEQTNNDMKKRVNSSSKREKLNKKSDIYSGGNSSILKRKVTDPVTEIAPMSKKQKGRPPKMQPNRNPLPDLEESTISDTPENFVPTPVVEKRKGRPPKIVKNINTLPDLETSTALQFDDIISDSEIAATSDSLPQEIDKPVPPKRRGRPPSLKNASSIISSTPSPSTSSRCENDLDKPSDETVKIPKKRGRKRKCDTIVSRVDEPLSEIKREPEVMEVSRYGRRRKVVNYRSLSNPGEHGDDDKTEKSEVLDSSFSSTCSADVQVINVGTHGEAVSQSNSNDTENYESSLSDEKEDEDSEEAYETKSQKKSPKSRRERVGGVTIGSVLEPYGGVAGIEQLLVDSSFNEGYAMVLEPVKIEDPSKDCRCGVCGKIVDKLTWKQHDLKIHNSLAWRVGEQPLVPSDRKFILRTLQKLYLKKIPLHCYKCGHKVKSVWGFLSHLAMCKKPIEEIEKMRIKCHICGSGVFPMSVSYHVKSHYKAKAENCEPKTSNRIEGKRKAAEKAIETIQNITSELEDCGSLDFYRKHFTNKLLSGFNFLNHILTEELNSKKVLSCIFRFCDYSSDTVASMAYHMTRCIHKPKKRFYCKICLGFTATESEMVTHLKEAHEIVDRKPCSKENDPDFKVADLDSSEAEKKIIKGIFKYPAHCQTMVPKLRVINPLSFKLMIEILKSEMSSENLFRSYDCRKSDWRLIDPDELKEYLPHEDMYWSCNVSRQVFTGFKKQVPAGLDFKKYEIFESELHDNGYCTIYCGGPISAMSWLPTPIKDRVDQVLAVATLKHPDDCFNAFKNYNTKTLVQFWKFNLKNCDNYLEEQPNLAFCIGVDYGPVWHLEWCPSGCFDYNLENGSDCKMKRLGLLAVAGSNGEVNIYAVPDIDNGNFFHVAPVMKLVLSVENTLPVGNDEFYASKISWSKGSGHNYIAVGYTNGTVGFFSLNGVVKLTKDVNGVRILYPYQTILAHLGPITALHLHYLEGNRFLMTGSMDRRSSFWDLNGSLSPVFTGRRMVVSDAIWLNTTASHVIAFEEGSANANNGVLTRSLCNLGRDYSRPSCLIPSPTSVTALTGSEWLYSLLSGNTAGEIMIGFLHKSIDNLDKNLKRYKRLLLGYTELVDTKKKLNSDPVDSSKENEPVHYNEAIEKYGLVFCDADVAKYSNFLTKHQPKNLFQWTKVLKQPKTDLFPLQSIRRAAFNPNVQWCKTYAVGYHAGFVRLSSINFLDDDISFLKRNYML